MSSKSGRIKFPNTLSFRLTFWYASTFLMCVFVAMAGLYAYLDTVLNHRMDEDLKEDIAEFREILDEGGMEQVMDEIVREINSSDETEVFLQVLNSKGNVVFSTDVSEWEDLADKTVAAFSNDMAPARPVLKTVEFPEHEYPVRLVLGQIGSDRVLLIGETLEKKEEIMELLLQFLAVMMFVGIPLASGVGWVIARKAVRGIEEVSRAAQDIERGDLERRVTIKAREEEIQRLMTTFNAMAARIRGLIHEMRDMTDNIAHDLRSPLARIRVMSERALSGTGSTMDYKRAAADTLKECDRLMHLINTTLDMAEVDAGVMNGMKEPIQVSKLVADLCELFGPVAEEKHIKLNVRLDPDCEIIGTKHHLQRMVANLLDNAMKYTPADGQVSIELIRSPHQIRLSIMDTGVGIPPPDQPRVFDRFFRCEHSRSQEGCGLGLSFARSVARAHGGDITVTSGASQGSTFTSILSVGPSTSS